MVQSFTLETTRPGRLPKKALIHDEVLAKAQLRKAVDSQQFEHIVLIWNKETGPEVLYDSATQARQNRAAADRQAGGNASKIAARASWALVFVLGLAIVLYGLEKAFNS